MEPSRLLLWSRRPAIVCPKYRKSVLYYMHETIFWSIRRGLPSSYHSVCIVCNCVYIAEYFFSCVGDIACTHAFIPLYSAYCDMYGLSKSYVAEFRTEGVEPTETWDVHMAELRYIHTREIIYIHTYIHKYMPVHATYKHRPCMTYISRIIAVVKTYKETTPNGWSAAWSAQTAPRRFWVTEPN